jgi:radical SAM superfamily enzyme YgiQ (UPF0313 family)
MKVLLIQPRAHWGKHPYLPNGLLALASILMTAKVTVKIIDMNIYDKLPSAQQLITYDWIGIGVLGAPYIPPAIRLAKQLREQGYQKRILFGGPVIDKIKQEDWQKLFSANDLDNIVAIQSDGDLKAELGLINLPSIYNCSISKAINLLPKKMKRIYFSKEFCIFTSDGCMFKCSFCAANKGRSETFRNLEVFEDEMKTISKMVKKYAGENPDYEIYLSTLDGLQNYEEMEKTLTIIHEEFTKASVVVPLRFLATSAFTYKAVQDDPSILQRWSRLGVKCIGIGVDGDDEKTWQRIRKAHNKRNQIQIALTAIQDADMIPEAFMIFGFPEESQEATLKAMEACKSLTKQGIKLRPYFAKNNPPGTEGFQIDPYLKNVNLFLHLDYGMIGSELTHPDINQRLFANEVYLKTISWLNKFNPFGCPTQPLLPSEDGNSMERQIAITWNESAPMDR